MRNEESVIKSLPQDSEMFSTLYIVGIYNGNRWPIYFLWYKTFYDFALAQNNFDLKKLLKKCVLQQNVRASIIEPLFLCCIRSVQMPLCDPKECLQIIITYRFICIRCLWQKKIERTAFCFISEIQKCRSNRIAMYHCRIVYQSLFLPYAPNSHNNLVFKLNFKSN